MLKIMRGKNVRSVTSGAFKSIYEPAGWKPVDASEKPVAEQPPAGGGADAELLALRQQAKELGVAYASQMGWDKLLEAIAAKKAEQPPAGGGASDQDKKMTDEELLETPVGEMSAEDMERAAALISYDYKAEGVTVEQLPTKLAEKLAAR